MIFLQLIGLMFAFTVAAFIGGYFGVSFSSNRGVPSHRMRRRDFLDLTRRVLGVLGLLTVVVGLGADQLGLGDSPGVGFMQRQFVLAGAAILGIASVITVRAQTAKEEADEN